MRTLFDRAIGLKYVKTDFNLTFNHDDIYNPFIDGRHLVTSGGFPDGTLILSVFIDLYHLDNSDASTKKSHEEVDFRVQEMVTHLDGYIYSIVRERTNDYRKTQYEIKLSNVNDFESKLREYSLLQRDREFNEALEAKLLEE